MATLNPFTINETSVSGAGANIINNAGGFTGSYTEVATFDGAGNFYTSILWQATSIYNTSSSPVPNQIGSFTPNQYGLYGMFQGSGTYSTSGSGVTTFNFAPSGSMNVWIDPSSNTTFAAPLTGNLAWTAASAGDDNLVASGVPATGTGTLNPFLSTCQSAVNPGGTGNYCGSFGTTTTFNLTALGSAYFTSPAPFYNMSFESGQLENFTPSATQTIMGSLNVEFGNRVPEPASVALLGIGLVGLSLSLRRRKQG
jgi:hypothetical protein